MNKRIESLDWLRGLMAISIMAFHLTVWSFGDRDSSTLLGRLSIYGVSIFFVLSGLSMAIVYSKYIKDVRTSIFFFLRRVFRIWPLLWVCVALIVVLRNLQGGGVSMLRIISNVTTLFGFIKPADYINTGAWSVGNEMVYYAFTPLIIYLYNKKVLYGNFVVFLCFLVACVFAFRLLAASESLANQWSVYINPFNNIFLYIAGFALYYNFHEVKINPFWNLSLLAFSVLLFIFFPVTGDPINIVAGFNRLLFVGISISLTLAFYMFALYQFVPAYISVPLEKFGIATYGVYLLHPVVWEYLTYMLGYPTALISKYVYMAAVCALTILGALFSYNFLEKRFMAVGKRITG